MKGRCCLPIYLICIIVASNKGLKKTGWSSIRILIITDDFILNKVTYYGLSLFWPVFLSFPYKIES